MPLMVGMGNGKYAIREGCCGVTPSPMVSHLHLSIGFGGLVVTTS